MVVEWSKDILSYSMSLFFIIFHYKNIIKYYKNMLTLEKRNVIIKTVKGKIQTFTTHITRVIQSE